MEDDNYSSEVGCLFDDRRIYFEDDEEEDSTSCEIEVDEE